MEDVLAYLELKNRYYSKFLSITEKFLLLARTNKWDGLDLFVDSRERIINIIKAFDFKIAAAFERECLTSEQVNSFRPRVKELLDLRNSLVSKIVAADLELIQNIEDMKSDTIRELKKTISVTQQIHAFEGEPIPRRKSPKHAA